MVEFGIKYIKEQVSHVKIIIKITEKGKLPTMHENTSLDKKNLCFHFSLLLYNQPSFAVANYCKFDRGNTNPLWSVLFVEKFL